MNERSPLILPADAEFRPGVPKPESDYRELARLGKKLGIPVPMTYISVAATNPDGSAGERYEDRSRTYNRNYWNWLFRSFGQLEGLNGLSADATFGAGHLGLKRADTGAVINTSGSSTAAPPKNVGIAPAGSGALGIVVGTGLAAENFDDHQLNALIAHGAGAGQLSYTASTFQQPAYLSLEWTAQVIRVLNNNSGGSIVVGETGIYAHNDFANAPIMLCRDLLGATVTVLNAGQLTVTYTITLEFPA